MVEINNLTAVSVDEEFLKKIATIILKGEKKKEADVSIALVGPHRIREINKKYRGKNKTTDVLAFLESSKQKSFTGLGEIVICPKEVGRNAKKFNLTFKKELAQVLIHGILHLLRYDHEKTEKEAKIMTAKQAYYLKLFFNGKS